MAAVLIVAGLAIREKVEQRKEKKRLKKANAEARYRELQVETSERLARRESGNVLESAVEEEPLQDSENEDQTRPTDDVAPPPAYEDVVQAGERRERDWQTEMQQRRSSVNSSQGRSAASPL